MTEIETRIEKAEKKLKEIYWGVIIFFGLAFSVIIFGLMDIYDQIQQINKILMDTMERG